jgi:glutathione synthase/RimK-type ligase-like ATP-grasp enzyme
VALDLARKFWRTGVEVFAADSLWPHLCQTSKAVKGSFRLPGPRLEPLEFAHQLDQLVQEQCIDLVIPTCEEVFYVAHAAALSDTPERYFVDSPDNLNTLHNKWLFGQLVQDLGFSVPPTRLLQSPKDLNGLPALKQVLKPVYSRFAAQAMVLQPKQKPPALLLSPVQPWLVQEFIEGVELCSYSVARAGVLAAHVCYRPLWRAGRGASVCFESIQDAQTLAFAQAVVTRLNFTGQIAFDYIRSNEGLYVLECNPRATSGVHLLGDVLIKAFGPSDGLIEAKAGHKAALRLPMLSHALGSALRAGTVQQWWQDFNAAGDVIADRQDPNPLWYQWVCFAGVLAQARKHYIGSLAATTVDIEWNGEKAERQTLNAERKTPKAILFEQSIPASWPESDIGQYAARVLPELTQVASSSLIANAQTKIHALQYGDLVFPFTVNESEEGNTFVCSPFTQYVSYAGEELRELKQPALERVLQLTLQGLGWWLKQTRLDDVVMVNNWLLSTNLYPPLSVQAIRDITYCLAYRFPDKAIVWRSVHGFGGSPLARSFVECGYRLVPSRSVLFYDTLQGGHWLRRDFKQDVRMLEQSAYRLRKLDNPTAAELKRVQELYSLLYIHKYSLYNPQYTVQFFELAAKGLLEFYVLEDQNIDAAMGLYARGGMMAAPVFGYDTHLPQELGLYRMLSACLTLEAERRGLVLHASSGVAGFKRSRGALPETEWTAVYDRHLPLKRRLGWESLRVLYGDIALPLLRRMGV